VRVSGCQHKDRTGRPSREEIRNGNDQVIGVQCRICLAILWAVGECDGCGLKGAKLIHVVVRDGKTRRYHSAQCHKNENARRAAEAGAKWEQDLAAKRAAGGATSR
jgi:hypothetical protein